MDEVFGDINAGDAIHGSFSFDSSAVDQIPGDPSTGSYTSGAPLGITVTIGTHSFQTSDCLNIGIFNGFVDQYTLFAESAAGDLTLELFLQDNTGSAFDNDHLPLNPPPLDTFTQRDFHLDAIVDGAEVQADGRIDTLTSQTVPEPSATVPILAGSILLLASAGRRRFLKRTRP